VDRDSGTDRTIGGWLQRLVRPLGFKFQVRQPGTDCCPDISVPTQAPSSCEVRVCIVTEMSFPLQITAGKHHNLSHFKLEATPQKRETHNKIWQIIRCLLSNLN
jgi:hypothetical protein